MVKNIGTMWRIGAMKAWPFALLSMAFLMLYALTTVPRHPNGGDNLWYIPTAINLLTRGSTDVSCFADDLAEIPPWEGVWITEFSKDPRIVKVGDKGYNLFPIGTSLVCLPLTWLHMQRYPPEEQTNLVRYSSLMAGRFAAIFAGASVGMLGLVLVGLGSSRRQAVLIALIYGLATPHFSTHAKGLWSHNPFAFFLLLALFLLVFRRGKLACWAALPLALCYTIRPDASILIVTLSVFVLVNHPKQLPVFALLGAASATAFIIYSLSCYRTFLPPYYLASRLQFSPQIWEAFAGHLISPNRGLLTFSPVFIFSFAGLVVTLIKRKEMHPLLLYLVPLPLINWLIISLFPHWWGGHSYGPRLWCSTIPILMLMLLPVYRWFPSAAGYRARSCRGLITMIFLATIVWGAFIQYAGVTRQSVHDWNEKEPNIDLHPAKIWDWSDMQIGAKSHDK